MASAGLTSTIRRNAGPPQAAHGNRGTPTRSTKRCASACSSAGWTGRGPRLRSRCRLHDPRPGPGRAPRRYCRSVWIDVLKSNAAEPMPALQRLTRPSAGAVAAAGPVQAAPSPRSRLRRRGKPAGWPRSNIRARSRSRTSCGMRPRRWRPCPSAPRKSSIRCAVAATSAASRSPPRWNRWSRAWCATRMRSSGWKRCASATTTPTATPSTAAR